MPNVRRVGRKIRDWDPEDMLKAVAEVRAGRLSLRAAAAQFRVTKSSLNERVCGRVAFGCLYEQKPLLTPADENSLVHFCLYCARYGFTLTKPEVLVSALALYNQRNPEATKKTLGQTWWLNFRERHLEQLTTPIPDMIDQGPETSDINNQGRAMCVKREPIEDYFKILQNTIDELRLRDKPQQIYCCHDTVFPLGRHNVQGIKKSNKSPGTRDHVTLLACFNAAGEDVPPLAIYKGGYPSGPYSRDGVPKTLFEMSQSGNMDVEIFHKWFTKHFLKYASEERPLLLVMDGHKFHLGPEVVQEAEREGVIFLGLPPHSSHILQPLDEHFFEPLKSFFPGSNEPSASSGSFQIFRRDFSQVLKYPYQRVKSRRTVVDGFKRCGLYPFDPDAIDWARVSPSPPPSQLNVQSSQVQIKEKQRLKQKEEFTVCVKKEESSEPDVQVHWSPESSLMQDIPQSEEETSIKEEELPPQTDLVITNVVSLQEISEKPNYSSEPFSGPETKIQDECDPPASTSAAQTETEADGDHDNKQAKIKSTKHRRRAMTGQGQGQNHQCRVCTRRFTAERYLHIHERVHVEVIRFSCPICNKPFFKNYLLSDHMKVHRTLT